ncbi:MAG: hypothetical protein QOI06_1992 [Nocardioidaceae bacterium]|jgi:uncharacterized protein (TIGR03089 family)|nr:hypothetical protein [Nocardioidaceae bacterium]
MTVLAALAGARRTDPGRPLITMYDDETGERVELSLATFDNWVCKLANLFSAEWAIAPGELVYVDMPPHWQSVAAMVGAWTSGLTVSLVPSSDAAVSIVGPAATGGPQPAGHVLACSLRPLGQGFAAALPEGWLDFATEVPPQPDALLIPHVVNEADDALVEPTARLTHADLVRRGRASATTIGLTRGGRLLTNLNPAVSSDIAVALLAPLVTNSSVVLLLNASDDRREVVATQERVTCTSWS